MKQIVKFEVFLSNEEAFVKTKPVHVFQCIIDCVEDDSNDASLKKRLDFEWHVRSFVNGCREVYSQVYVNKTVLFIDFDFDLV